MCSDNGLVPNRRQAVFWTNADPFRWRIYAALGGGELMEEIILHKACSVMAFLDVELRPFIFLFTRSILKQIFHVWMMYIAKLVLVHIIFYRIVLTASLKNTSAWRCSVSNALKFPATIFHVNISVQKSVPLVTHINTILHPWCEFVVTLHLNRDSCKRYSCYHECMGVSWSILICRMQHKTAAYRAISLQGNSCLCAK